MKVKRVKMYLTGVQYMTEEEYKRMQEKRDWIDEENLKTKQKKEINNCNSKS